MNTNESNIGPTADVAIEPTTKPARIRNRKPAMDASGVRDMRTLVRFAKTVTPANFADAIAAVNANHGVTHAARNVGRFTRTRIMDFQNETLRDNVDRQLDDVQLLFVWRAEFPMGVGRVFTADVITGIGIVRGVRADYNRAPGHHGAKFPVTAESVRYGAARFVIPGTSAGSPTIKRTGTDAYADGYHDGYADANHHTDRFGTR